MDHPLKKGANVGVVIENGQGTVGCIISEPEIEDGKYSYKIEVYDSKVTRTVFRMEYEVYPI